MIIYACNQIEMLSVNKGVYYLLKRNKCILKRDPGSLNLFSTAKILKRN